MRPIGVDGFSSVRLKMNQTERLHVSVPMIITANRSRAYLTIAGEQCPLYRNGALVLGRKEGVLQRRMADIRIADAAVPLKMFSIQSIGEEGAAPIFSLTALSGTVNINRSQQRLAINQNESLQLADGDKIIVQLDSKRVTHRLEIVFHFTAPVTSQAPAIEPLQLTVVRDKPTAKINISEWGKELFESDHQDELRQALKQAREGEMAVIEFLNQEILNLSEADLYDLIGAKLFRPILDFLTCEKLAELAADEATTFKEDEIDNPLDLVLIKLLELAERGNTSALETLSQEFLEIVQQNDNYCEHLNEYHLFKRILRVLSSDALVGMFNEEMNYNEENLNGASDVLAMEVLRRAKQGDQACCDYIDNDLPQKEWDDSFKHWAAFGIFEQLLERMNSTALIEMTRAPHDDDAVNDQLLEKVVSRAEAKDAECLHYLNEDLLTDNWSDEALDRFAGTGLLGRIAQVVSTATLITLNDDKELNFYDGDLLGAADVIVVSLVERAEAGDKEALEHFRGDNWNPSPEEYKQHLEALGVARRVEKIIARPADTE